MSEAEIKILQEEIYDSITCRWFHDIELHSLRFTVREIEEWSYGRCIVELGKEWDPG